MYPISNTVLALFQSGAMQYARLTIGSSTIANDRIKQGTFSINRYVETNESVAIGSCVAAEMVLVLDNYDGTYDNTDFVGSEAYVEIGVEDTNHTIQYIPQGYFTFDEATRTKNTVSLAALDRMTKFDIVVNASQLSFPYTLTNLLDRICTLCGVTKGTFTLTNASYSVASLPSEAKTYRDLLRWICEVSGSNAYISYDGKLYLGWYGTTSQFNILPSNRTSSDLDKNTFSITGVTILTGDNQKYTAGTNTRPITITNNPFITTTQAQSVATTLNTKLGGFSYCPFTAVMLPSPMIFPMDRATFTTAEGTSVAVSVSEVTYKLNGSTAIACKGEMQVRGRSYGLADQTFYASNIAAGAVTADKISAGAITSEKIQTGAVTSDAINSSVDMATNAAVAATYATKAAASSQEQRIYYRSNSTTAPTAPTTWVTSTSTANATWTTKRMQYDSTYKYLYTCIQRKTVSGSISNSTVLLDDTTTVIDGGNIITGTVVANKIASNAVTSDKIQAEAVTADKISVTDLQTLRATIAGWNIGTDRISKTVNGKSAVISSSVPSVIMSKTNNSAEINGNAEIIAQRYVSDDNNGYTKLLGRELSQLTEIWEVHATWADYIRKNESLMADGTLTLKGRDIDPETLYLEDNFKTAVLNYKDLTFNGNSLKRLTPHLAQMWATWIPANANLNTKDYTEVKTYYCEANETAQSLSNCPVTDAFTMTVEAPNQSNYSNDNDHVRYRVRIIKTYVGRQYVQYCHAASGGSTWTYSAWKKIVDGFEDTDNAVGWFKTMGARLTSLDIPHYYDDRARMRLDLSTSSQTGGVNAVFGEGYVFTFMWDSNARWDSQLYIPDADGRAPAYRVFKPSANAWSDVYRFVTSGLGNYISNSNLNNYTESGFYIVGSGNTNAPESWAAMIVCSAGNVGYGVHQMVFNVNGMWIRSYTGSPLAWTSWSRKF